MAHCSSSICEITFAKAAAREGQFMADSGSLQIVFHRRKAAIRNYSSAISALCSGTSAAFFSTLIGKLTFTVDTLSA